MERKEPLNILVLGAGISGLCAAWNLVQDGHRVIVLEKKSYCGGLGSTFQRGGYRYDLGPHNIHSQKESVIDFLKKNFAAEIFKHNFFAQIYFRKQRLDYPITGKDVLVSINYLTAISCMFSFFFARLRSLFIPKFRDDGSYENWIINRFGRKFYNIYFSPYSEKVWKMPANQISDIVAKKRIVTTGIIELIHSIIFKRQRYHPENPRTVNNYYFQYGVGAIADFFLKGITDLGGEVITDSEVEEIIVEGDIVRKVSYVRNGKTENLNLGNEDNSLSWRLLSTIPINEMIMKIKGDIPEEVKAAAENLDFTSEVLLYLNVNKPDIFKVPLLYFSEPEFPFNRCYDLGIFSRKMVPEGKNAICLEVTCEYGDQIWNMSDSDLFEKCIEILEKHKLLNRVEVEEYHTKRLEHAYPRFRVGYENNLNMLFEYINNVYNLISFGRQGLFSYSNIDDAIWMGFTVAKDVGYNDRIKLSMKELLPDYISF